MLSKRELKERYEKLLREHEIVIQSEQKKFSDSYLNKALHNLEVAGILNRLTSDDESKKSIGIPANSNYSDWVIVTSYYAMYLAATSALARLGLKCSTHGATRTALEFRYCVHKSRLDRKYIEMLENASFGKEDIEKLDYAMHGRVSVQYTVSKKYGDNEAKRILKDAKEFVNKIGEITR